MDLVVVYMFQCVVVDFGVYYLLYFFFGIQFDFFIWGSGFKFFFLLVQCFKLLLVIGEIVVVGYEIGVDVVFVDVFVNDVCVEVGDFKQCFQFFFVDVFFYCFDIVVDIGYYLVVVVFGVVVVEMVCFQYYYVGDFLFCQFKGGVNVREVVVDNYYIGFNIFLQCWEMEVIFFCCVVVVQCIDFDVYCVILWFCLV